MARLNRHGEIEDPGEAQKLALERPPRMPQPPPAGKGGNACLPIVVAAVLGVIAGVAGLLLVLGEDGDAGDPVVVAPTATDFAGPPPGADTPTPVPTDTPAPTPTPSPTPIPTATPAPAARSKQTDCLSGGVTTQCTLNYRVGPASYSNRTLRVDFTVTLTGPAGATTGWVDDPTFNADSRATTGAPAVYISDSRTSAHLADIRWGGGVAIQDGSLSVGTTYGGWWEFDLQSAPGNPVLLHYPDFPANPVPLTLPVAR